LESVGEKIYGKMGFYIEGQTLCVRHTFKFSLSHSNQTHCATSRKVAGSIPDWVHWGFSLT